MAKTSKKISKKTKKPLTLEEAGLIISNILNENNLKFVVIWIPENILAKIIFKLLARFIKVTAKIQLIYGDTQS